MNVTEHIAGMAFDLREFSDVELGVEGMIRADIGSLNIERPVELQAIFDRVLQDEMFNYAPTFGEVQLLSAIEQFNRDIISQFSEQLKHQVLITSGGQAGLFATLFAFISKGDAILVDQAYYPPYQNIATLLQAELIPVDMDRVDTLELPRNIRVCVLNSPQNPTGKVFQADTLQKVAEVAERYDCLIIEDRVYDHLFFDCVVPSIVSYAPQRTIYLNSASKNFALPGLRVGWLIGEKKLITNIAKVHRNINSSPSGLLQKVCAELLVRSDDYIMQIRIELKKRYERMKAVFEALDWEYMTIEGGIYMMARPTQFNLHSKEDYLTFITETRISCIPGYLFGERNRGWIRFCFGAIRMYEIEEVEGCILGYQSRVN